MAQNTTISGLPYPELTDIPNAQTAFSNLATALDSIVIPRYATSTARDTAIGSPGDGQHLYRQDIHVPQYYSAVTGGYVSPGMVLLQRVTLGADTASVTFSSIPGDFSHLHVKMMARSANASGNDSVSIKFNGDASAAYDWTTLFYNDSATPGISSAGNNGVTANSGRLCPVIPGATDTAAVFGHWQVDIMNYTDATQSKVKNAVAFGGMGGGASDGWLVGWGGATYTQSSPAAITSVTFLLGASGANIKAGSVFSLYGVS